MHYLTVIPAKAGIQSKYASEGHLKKVLSASHDVFALDSGLRRNDGGARLAITLKPRGRKEIAGIKKAAGGLLSTLRLTVVS
ncbi:hypothetical protein GCM10007901_17640 [Dyella acidisoli]|uniref:Uncharacterized protein n=1 Tax=Dyella acidisoli TaxID=1867834 RepID=A0ABQ5XP18_9GAMM|nr:hypothetical protein GCM10007901_17640 [Dyella acidisoli]